MYHVVKEVDRYKEFLIYASDSYISNVRDHDHFDGTIGVNFKIYKDAFNSTVTCTHDKDSGQYVVSSVAESNSMFKEMVSIWKITDHKEAKNTKETVQDESKNGGNSSDNNDTLQNCSIDYYIKFEFQNSFYTSAASYVMDFVGGATYDQFIKRAKELYINTRNVSESGADGVSLANLKPEEKAAVKKFQEKINNAKAELTEEILIMKHIKHLANEKLFTNNDYENFFEMYERDEDFNERVHTIYDIYNTEQEVDDNQQKIIFMLKKSMREFE